MQKATSSLVLLGTLIISGLAPAVVQAQVLQEAVAGFHGSVLAVPNEVGADGLNPGVPNAVTIAYDNTASAPIFGFSSTDLSSIWGDRLILITTGAVSSHAFTIFNTGSSLGNLLTAQVAVDFFDSGTSAHLGGYTTAVNFGSGLPPGFFSIVTVPGLDALNILIPNADVIVTQQLTGTTGPANRLGIASLDPPTIGASPLAMFIQSATVNAGIPGFYNVGNPALPANPGYQLGLEDVPTGTVAQTWGRMKAMYR